MNEERDGSAYVIFGILLALLIVVGIVDFNEKRSEVEACADVGGEYTVVGQEFSASAKRTVDIYGCVNK